MAIFLENGYSNNYDYEVAPSKYEPTIEGALMHVWENSQNFQRIIEAATIAEMSDADYFMNEASASGLLNRFKSFFTKVIEKIKSIVHKAIMVLNSLTMKNKEFVKKYKTEVRRKMKPKKLSMTCHLLKLNDLDKNDKFESACNDNKDITTWDDTAGQEYTRNTTKLNNGKLDTDGFSDKINDKIEEENADFLGDLGVTNVKSCTYSEAIEEYKDFLIDEPETIDEDDADRIIISCMNWIESCDDAVKKLRKAEKAAVKSIDRFIKNLERLDKDLKPDYNDDTKAAAAKIKTQNINADVKIWQARSNLITGCLGVIVQAYNMRAKESRALCVKWVMGKVEESAAYSPMGASDPFAGVSMI